MAAEATARALDGKPGNDEYNRYWTHAFNFFSPQYTARSEKLPPIPAVLDDAETDQLFDWFTTNGIYGMPADILPANREKLTADLPNVAAKFFRQAKVERAPNLTGEESA